jgi:uncharacterized membrane protein YfcA
VRFAVLCLGAFLIGLTKAGFSGGTGMVLPVLAMVMPARIGLGLMLPLLMASDVIVLTLYRGQWDRRNVAVLLPASLAGIALGACLLARISSDSLSRLIGLLALVFGGVQLRRAWRPSVDEELPPRFRPWLGVLAGFSAGVSSTLAHIGGVLTSMFLLPQRLGPSRFVATATATYFFMNLGKLPAYWHQGLLPPEIWRQAALLLPAVAVGAGIGFFMNGRVSPRRFDAVVLAIVFTTGLYLVARPASSQAHADRHALPLQPRPL